MRKLILITLILLSSQLTLAQSDRYLYTALKGPEFRIKISLKSLELPALADDYNHFYMGDNEFEMRLEFNKRSVHHFTLPENKNNQPVVYENIAFDKTGTGDEIRSRNHEVMIDYNINIYSTDLNNIVYKYSYKEYKETFFPSRRGRICLISDDLIYDQLSNYGCLEIVMVVNDMVRRGQTEREVQVEEELVDETGEAYHKDFPTPIRTVYKVEILK